MKHTAGRPLFCFVLFLPRYFMGVFVTLGFLFKSTQGHYRFSSLLFSVLLSFLPADFTFYDANGGCMVLSFSPVSWSVGLRDIFNRI